MVKIIKNLKFMRILMKTHEDTFTLKKLAYDPKNVIYLDHSYDSAKFGSNSDPDE